MLSLDSIMKPTLALFNDLIDALSKVAGGLKAIVNLPKAQRDEIRHTLAETFRLIDTTLNMVIIRLGDILLKANNDDFLREAALLDNYTEWMQAEREFRLCQSLRVALRETETLAGSLPAPRVRAIGTPCSNRCASSSRLKLT